MKPPRKTRPAGRPAPAGSAPWAPLLVALVAGVSHLPSLANGFARDDAELIPALLRAGRPLGTWLVSDFWAPCGSGSGLWRPVVTFSLWLDGRWGGGQPLAFHAGNVLAHALASGLLCALLRASGLPVAGALAGSLWFAVMPAHAEAVAWVVGRTDVLSAAAGIAALLLDRRARAGGSGLVRAASVGAFALALLAKESAAGLVLVLLAIERVDERRPSLSSTLRWTTPWWLVTLAWVAAHRAFAGPGGPLLYVSPDDPATWPALAWRLVPHFALSLVPGVAHSPDALPRIGFGTVGGAIATLALLGLAAWLAWRRSRALPGLALFLAPLLPPVAVALAGRALPAGERLVYLASAGMAWWLALGLAQPRARAAGGLALAAVAALVAVSAFESVRLQPAWRDDASVYAAMTRAQPRDPVGWLGLADATAQRGERAEAERLLAHATALGPRVPARHVVRAALHYRYGEWPAVLSAADSALAALPGLAAARVLRATALVRLRRLDEAELDTRELLAVRPDDPQVLAVEGQRLLLAGDPAGAVARLEGATRGEVGDVASWYALGIARAVLGHGAEAQRAFERTVELDPAYYDGWLGLARAAVMAGDGAAATTALARADALPESSDGRAARLRTELGPR